MDKLLQRYWLKITGGGEYLPNIGVTAYSEQDAIRILRDKIKGTISIDSIEKINSIDELDQNHVVPNMEEFVSRGIWFPKGYKPTN